MIFCVDTRLRFCVAQHQVFEMWGAIGQQRGNGFHAFRHANATLMNSFGASQKLRQQRLGHAEITQFLRLAFGLATALGGLHKRELIHKDVKPTNVLVNPATGQVSLMGSGWLRARATADSRETVRVVMESL